jgi:hypothetical protein
MFKPIRMRVALSGNAVNTKASYEGEECSMHGKDTGPTASLYRSVLSRDGRVHVAEGGNRNRNIGSIFVTSN